MVKSGIPLQSNRYNLLNDEGYLPVFYLNRVNLSHYLISKIFGGTYVPN